MGSARAAVLVMAAISSRSSWRSPGAARRSTARSAGQLRDRRGGVVPRLGRSDRVDALGLDRDPRRRRPRRRSGQCSFAPSPSLQGVPDTLVAGGSRSAFAIRRSGWGSSCSAPAAVVFARPDRVAWSIRSLLDRAGEQALHEVALEGEEHHQRDRQREERRRRDQLDVRAELAQLGEDRDRDRLRVAAEGQRDEQVVPRPQELEDRQRGDRRQARAAGSGAGRSASPTRRRSAPPPGGRCGIPMKKLRSRKIANGSPNAVWKRTRPSTVSNRPSVVVEREDRDQRHLQRHDEQRDHDDEQPVAAGEVEPRERVAGQRGDDDRQDACRRPRSARSSSSAIVIASLSKICS